MKFTFPSNCGSKILNRYLSTDSATLVSFRNVSFEYNIERGILAESNFSIRKGSKVTIMGQNGSGKSTIIKLINGSLQCTSGMINLNPNLVVSTAFQVMPTQYRLT
mmetsp:Transcript_29484/g.42066  ORF Transcript_29484/g.42066 Transcript_29484/m.42066 type:complete len:106 (+) Transcript_29484:1-318(+)